MTADTLYIYKNIHCTEAWDKFGLFVLLKQSTSCSAQ